MRISIIVVVAMISALTVSAQQSNKVDLYYKAVNKAELAILDSNFVGASSDYRSAFQKKFPNDKDLYNAFILAYYMKDSVVARTYIEKLAYLGLDRSLLPDTTQNLSFYKRISMKFDSCYNAGKRSQLYKLGMKLKEIGAEDQAVRRELAADPYLKSDARFQERLRKSDSTIFSQMKNYIKVYGFPSFEKKGFWDGSSPNNPSVVFWMIYHQRPRGTILDSFVYKAVLDGNFRPDEWATLISYRNDEKAFNYNIRSWRPIDDVVSDRNKVTSSRQRIYLENEMDFRRKWDFARANQEKKRQNFLLHRKYDRSGLFNNLFFLNFFILPTDEEIKQGM